MLFGYITLDSILIRIHNQDQQQQEYHSLESDIPKPEQMHIYADDHYLPQSQQLFPNAQFYTQKQLIQFRNQRLFKHGLIRNEPNDQQLIIDIDRQIVKTLNPTLQHQFAFQSSYDPSTKQEIKYWHYLKKNFAVPKMNQVLDYAIVSKFIGDDIEELQEFYLALVQNFVCDTILRNFPFGGVYVICSTLEHININTFFNHYLMDRPYFTDLFRNMQIAVDKKEFTLLDALQQYIQQK